MTSGVLLSYLVLLFTCSLHIKCNVVLASGLKLVMEKFWGPCTNNVSSELWCPLPLTERRKSIATHCPSVLRN